jgi:protein-disulfide isomerase
MNPSARLRIPVTESDHAAGPSDAPITLVEYGDFQCEFCGRAFWEIRRLRQAMAGDLRFVFRNFPLAEIHPNAMDAAKAAEAAALQNSFWPMHDTLFTSQEDLDPDSLLSYASRLGLDLRKFARDMKSRGVGAKVAADFEGGVRSGVNGTPSFFVNGRRYDGEQSFEAFLDALTANRMG